MGLGDEIMAAGEARRLQKGDPRGRPVAIAGRDGEYRWSPLWNGNPRILSPARAMAMDRGAFLRLPNGPGCRPYIDYEAMRRDFAAVFPGRPFTTKARDPRLPWRYTDWRATPGELPRVRRLARGAQVVIEPRLKAHASPNKHWGRPRWQALVDLGRDFDWVQLGPAGTPVPDGVRHIPTETFTDACTVLSGAAAAVLPEGGLHHAAAALGIPAIVIFGGMTSPANTGYDGHVNLFEPAGGASPCGQRLPCGHCRDAMSAIRPEIVAYHLETMLT